MHYHDVPGSTAVQVQYQLIDDKEGCSIGWLFTCWKQVLFLAVSVFLSVRLSAQNLKNYLSEIDAMR